MCRVLVRWARPPVRSEFGRLQLQLLQPEVIDCAVSEFGGQLRNAASGISDDMPGHRKRKEELEREIKRFTGAIACGGPLDSPVHQIAIRQGELNAIANKLLSKIPASIKGRIRELRRFVVNGISNLQGLLEPSFWITSSLPTIHSEQLNSSCYARNSQSTNFHEHFNQERSI
jgi:hypothetical protein